VLLNLCLPQGTSVYERVKAAAEHDLNYRRKLLALEMTFGRFKIPMESREALAEALLRLELMVGKRVVPKPGDKKAKVLFEMFEFFQRQNK
jgi:hypothetical protein